MRRCGSEGLGDGHDVHHVHQDEDDGEDRGQRSTDPNDAPHVPHDVAVLLCRTSRQKPLAPRPARPLDFRGAGAIARPGPADIGGPLLGDDLGLEFLGPGFFLHR